MFAAPTEIFQLKRMDQDYDVNSSGISGKVVSFLPPFEIPQPWPDSQLDDFILLGEFSEIEGPKPLLAIPEKADRDFDENGFIVRLMSVDYQGTGRSRIPHSDSHIVLTEANGIFAYVHHFTLNDIKARGFVRPFCMSYITSDKRKLMTYFSELKKEFSEVSRLFLYGNRILFLREVEQRLNDLDYTKDKFNSWSKEKDTKKYNNTENTENEIFLNMTLENIDSWIIDLKLILDITKQYLNEPETETFLRNLEEKIMKKKQDSKMIDDSSYSRNLQESQQLLNIEPQRRKSLTDVDDTPKPFSFFEEEKHYKPKLVDGLMKGLLDNSLPSIHELCHWGAEAGMHRLRNMHKNYNRCFEVLHLEGKDSDYSAPESSLITLGSCIGGSMTYDMTSQESPSTGGYANDGSQQKLYSSCESPRHCYKSYHSVSSVCSSDSDSFSSSLSNLDKFLMPNSCSTKKVNEPNLSLEGSYDILNDLDSDTLLDSDLTFQDTCIKQNHFLRKSFAAHITTLNESSWSMSKILKNYNWARHIFYSLLIGRPVVLLGSEVFENHIKALIITLSVFIPGDTRFQYIIPWQRKPLQLLDLKSIRIVGLCRPPKKTNESMIPNSIKRYISLIDVDNKMVFCPKYQGNFLEKFHSKSEHFKNETDLMAYLVSCLLDIVNKSFLYYQYHIKEVTTKNCGKESNEISVEQKPSSVSNLSSKRIFELADEDLNIIKYFVEIIKEQQINADNNADSCPVFHAQLLKLDVFSWK